MRASRPSGISVARHPPPAHGDLLVHRQLAPQVADGQQVVEPGVGDHQHVGLGRGLQRGQYAAGAGRQDVDHLLGAHRHPLQAELAELGDRAVAAARAVKLPPSGKITKASLWSRPVASDAICDSRSSPAAGFGRDEAGRDPVEDHVDRRVPGEGVLEDDPRLAVVPVQQGVHQHERVAGPRVAAHHQHRPVGHPRRVRPVGADPQRQHPPGLAEEDDQRALHQVVVDAGEVGRADPPAEAAGQPQAEQHRAASASRRWRRAAPATARAAPATGRAAPGRAPRPPAASTGRVTHISDRQADHRRGHHQPTEDPHERAPHGAAELRVEEVPRGVVRRVDAGLHAARSRGGRAASRRATTCRRRAGRGPRRRRGSSPCRA